MSDRQRELLTMAVRYYQSACSGAPAFVAELKDLEQQIDWAGWQPIATAPKDGPILRWHVNWGPMTVVPNRHINRKQCPWMHVSMENTWPEDAFIPYWHALPEPPKEAAEEAAKR